LLTNSGALDRLAEGLVGGPVPEFWEDEASVDRFLDGFCYDIVAKLDSPKGTPAIITHLANEFDLTGGDDIESCRDKIEKFFDDGNSWQLDNWPQLP
jgi:hypothetical protein